MEIQPRIVSDRPKRIVVSPTENGRLGPLGGPFNLALESYDCAVQAGEEVEILATIISFVRNVARGVSCYNKNEFEVSSNLKSYAIECLVDMQSETPDAAARLENLVVDCRQLPVATKAHPIWELNRAILRSLPRVSFIE